MGLEIYPRSKRKSYMDDQCQNLSQEHNSQSSESWKQVGESENDIKFTTLHHSLIEKKAFYNCKGGI